MSTPIQNKDSVDDLQLYARLRARELSLFSGPSGQDVPPTAPETDVPEAHEPVACRWPRSSASEGQAAESPPVAPEGLDAGGARLQPKPEWILTRPKPATHLPQGLGGPNIPPPVPPGLHAGHAAPPGVEGIDAYRPERPTPPEFEGDTAIKALRHRLSLDPAFMPEAPPMRPRSKSVMPLIGRLSLVVLVAAAVACGITLLSLPDTRPAIFSLERVAAMVPLRADFSGPPQPASPQPASTQPASLQSPSLRPASLQQVPQQPASPQPAPRLVVEGGRQALANEALALGLSLTGATGGEFVLLTGLAAGTRLSAGGPFGDSGWRISARDLGKAVAYAPKDFVGVMNAAIDLRLPNDTLVDSKVTRLEWVARQPEVRARPAPPVREEATTGPATRPLDAGDVDTLVKRGQNYLRIGDIVSARLVLRRAVGARSAEAALTLGSSFDPIVLAELGALGVAPDVAQARAWYQQAAEFGSAEASRRLDRLARWGQ